MLPAYIAEQVLSVFKYKPAKPLFIEERAALIPGKPKVRRRLQADLPPQLFPHAARQHGIQLRRIIIYIYFPAKAAAVAAVPGSALKIPVKVRLYIKHYYHRNSF